MDPLSVPSPARAETPPGCPGRRSLPDTPAPPGPPAAPGRRPPPTEPRRPGRRRPAAPPPPARRVATRSSTHSWPYSQAPQRLTRPPTPSVEEGHVAHGLRLALRVHHDLVPAGQRNRGVVGVPNAALDVHAGVPPHDPPEPAL